MSEGCQGASAKLHLRTVCPQGQRGGYQVMLGLRVDRRRLTAERDNSEEGLLYEASHGRRQGGEETWSSMCVE